MSEKYERAVEYHEREQDRMEREGRRWWRGITGAAAAYAEAAYAHHAALIHLRRLFEPEEPKPGMEAGSGHNFERDMAPPDPLGEEPWYDRFGFQARTVGRPTATGDSR